MSGAACDCLGGQCPEGSAIARNRHAISWRQGVRSSVAWNTVGMRSVPPCCPSPLLLLRPAADATHPLAHPLGCRSGQNDRLIPAATRVQCHAATPGSRLLTVKDAWHAVPYQHPKQSAKQVLYFLNSAQPVSWAGGAVPVDRRLLLRLLVLCMLPAMLGQCADAPPCAGPRHLCWPKLFLPPAVAPLLPCSAARMTGVSWTSAATARTAGWGADHLQRRSQSAA